MELLGGDGLSRDKKSSARAAGPVWPTPQAEGVMASRATLRIGRDEPSAAKSGANAAESERIELRATGGKPKCEKSSRRNKAPARALPDEGGAEAVHTKLREAGGKPGSAEFEAGAEVPRRKL